MSAMGVMRLLMMSLNLRNIAILKINEVDYGCIITRISKNGAENLLQKTKKWNENVEHYRI